MALVQRGAFGERRRSRVSVWRYGAAVLGAATVVSLIPVTATVARAATAPQGPAAALRPSGGEQVGHGADAATIYRDSLGVPHIYAQTKAGMWFGVGWTQAADRMFQLELTRAAIEGDLSALFGSSQVSTDESQRLFFYTSAQYLQQYDALPASTKAAITAYARGINAYEAMAYASPQSEKRLVPDEFWALGAFYGLTGPYRPAPWRPVDTMVLGAYLTRQFGTGGGAELQNLAFLQYLQAYFAKQGDPNADATALAVFNDTQWIKDPSAPTTVPASCPDGPVLTSPSQSRPNACQSSPLASASGPAASPATGPPPAHLAAATPSITRQLANTATLRSIPTSAVLQASSTLSQDEQLLRQRGASFKVFSHEGSNAMAVAPWRSAHHVALLWGAPQEGFSTPSVNYEESLHGPGYDAYGMAITGEPFVLIGHNANVAWTTTSEETTDEGVFVEQARFSGSPPEPTSYYYDGSWVPVKVVRESIPVLHSSPVSYTFYRTKDGPIFSTDPSAGLAFSMDFVTWMQEYKTLQGFSELGGDTNLVAFRRSMREIVNVHDFMYADRQGNIAFFSAGRVPAHPSPFSTRVDPRLPRLGDGSQQWTSFVPFSQMPHSINPGQGYLDNWNTEPSQQVFYQPNEFRGTIFRSQRMDQMLAASTHITPTYLQGVERSIGTIDSDQTRPAASYFIPFLERAYQTLVAQADPLVDPATHPDLQGAMHALATWNDTSSIGSPAMSIFNQFLEALEHNVFGGGVAPGEQYVGAVDFNDASLGMGTYLQGNSFTENLLYHILAGSRGLVPCNTLCYKGHYFGSHRDQILVESLNDAISILSGTGTQLGRSVPGFGTPDIAKWGWQPAQSINWNSLDPVASAVGVKVNCGTSAHQERSSYFIDMAMAPVPFGYQLLPPGESGFINKAGVASPHLCDQVGLFNAFQYAPFSSSVSQVRPNRGPASGGKRVTLLGHGLSGATAVYFGKVPARRFTVRSDTSITAVAPPGSGTVDVEVVTPADPGGTAANPFDRFTYVASS